MASATLPGKAHDFLSQRILLPLASARQLARPATRPGMKAYFEGLRFRAAAARWTDDERRAWIRDRLRHVVRRAAREAVYYRALFERVGFSPDADFSFDDFARLPVLERADVRRDRDAMVSAALPADQLRLDATGGSTGAPTEVWLGPEERGWRDSGTEHFMRQIAIRAGSRVAYLWGHHLDPVAQDSLRERWRSFESNMAWFDCFRLSADVLESYHERLERLRPSCIIAYAGALAALADHLKEHRHQPGYPVQALVTGAEKLWPAQREVVEQVFKRPVHERYGGRDVGGLAFQLAPAQSLDYTVDWANVLIEPETTEQDSAILITKLRADGMLMLRYRVGDVARFPAGSLPGHPALVLHEVLGRALDRIWLRDGRWIHGGQLPHLMKSHPVREFMFRQQADYSVDISVVPTPGFGPAARSAILQTVRSNLPGLDVRLVEVGSIPRMGANKWRPVVTDVTPPVRVQA